MQAIAAAGVASRRGADELILEGKVRVNDRVVTELGTQVDLRKDKVGSRERGGGVAGAGREAGRQEASVPNWPLAGGQVGCLGSFWSARQALQHR